MDLLKPTDLYVIKKSELILTYAMAVYRGPKDHAYAHRLTQIVVETYNNIR